LILLDRLGHSLAEPEQYRKQPQESLDKASKLVPLQNYNIQFKSQIEESRSVAGTSIDLRIKV